MTYLALVKANLADSPARQVETIRDDLGILAGRLVDEWECEAEDVDDWFTDAVQYAYDAQRERELDA